MSRDRSNSRKEQWQRLRLRRVLAALLAGAAVVIGLTALRPPPEPTTSVVVAAHDVAAGERLTADDLEVQHWPEDVAPSGQPSAGDLSGRRVLGPVSSGEALTATRLVSRDTTTASAHEVTMGLPLVDPALAEVLRPQDRVDVLDAEGTVVVRAATVLDVLVATEEGSGLGSAGPTSAPSVLLAVPRDDAAGIAQARSGHRSDGMLLIARVSHAAR